MIKKKGLVTGLKVFERVIFKQYALAKICSNLNEVNAYGNEETYEKQEAFNREQTTHPS